MEGSNLDLQRGRVKSVSAETDDCYEKIQPMGTCQILFKVITAGKVILTLLAAVVLVAMLVAVILNQKQISELKERISTLKQTQQTRQTTAPPTGVLVSTASTLTTTTSPSVTNQTSCADILSSNPNVPSGVYTIHIEGRVHEREVWCDMVTDGGGWTRFQRRQDGSVKFNRTWIEYRTGFGTAEAEFWLGNDDLHILTSAQRSELRIDLWDWQGTHRYATYSLFLVGSLKTNYKLHVSGYKGTAGDSLLHNNNMQFSTIDQDHDYDLNHCALDRRSGGWWYHSCGHSNFNGRYYPGGITTQWGIVWFSWRKNWYSYYAASMMIRPWQ